MKKFMSMILMVAVVVTSVVVPNSNGVETVKASSSKRELTVNGQKYDNYVDFIEAYGIIEWGCEKVDLGACEISNCSHRYNGEYCYTYRECLKDRGYVIPDDCVSIVLHGNCNPYVAYKTDGTKVIIYNAEGYDQIGYDREGWDKDGYDREGYGRDGYSKYDNRDREGYNREGYDKWGYNREGYDKDGHSEKEEAEELIDYIFRAKQNKLGTKVTSINIKDYHYESASTPVKNMSLTKKNVNSKGFGEYILTAKFKNGHSYKISCVVTPYIDGADDREGSVWLWYANADLYYEVEGNKAIFHDGDGYVYKRYSGFDVVISSKKNGEGKVYYESKNHKLAKPTKYNARTHYFVPMYKGQKSGSNVCKVKNSKKGRYVTFKFYIKVNGKKYYGYSLACKITG